MAVSAAKKIGTVTESLALIEPQQLHGRIDRYVSEEITTDRLLLGSGRVVKEVL